MSNIHLVIGNKNYSSWSLRPWMALTMAGIPFRETVILLDTPDTQRQNAEEHGPPDHEVDHDAGSPAHGERS